MKRLFSFKLPFGRLWFTRDKGQAFKAGQIFATNLTATHYRDGKVVKEYDLGSGVVTNGGVALMSGDWNNSTPTLKLLKYHDAGIGTNAPTTGDITLQNTVLSLRTIGSQSGGINTYVTIAQIQFLGNYAITEWGLFSSQTGGTMWDRKTFTAINVISYDKLEFAYTLTYVSGG